MTLMAAQTLAGDCRHRGAASDTLHGAFHLELLQLHLHP